MTKNPPILDLSAVVAHLAETVEACAADRPGRWRAAGSGRDLAPNPYGSADAANLLYTLDRFPHLAGTFHYLFNYEHARRPHPRPAALVDTCLAIFDGGDEWPLGRTVSFAEIDWVYCLSRAMRRTAHRHDEGQRALRDFAVGYVEFLIELDWEADDGAADLHRVFGAACALAELQRALPGLLWTPRPLRLVLDRRPFI